MKGILDLAKNKRQSAEWNRAKAAAQHKDPRDAYEAEVHAKHLDAEADQLERIGRSDKALILNLELLIHDLTTSTDKTAYRALALRDIESASSWLRRELGYQED